MKPFENYVLTLDTDSEEVYIEAWDDGKGATYRGKIPLSDIREYISTISKALSRW